MATKQGPTLRFIKYLRPFFEIAHFWEISYSLSTADHDVPMNNDKGLNDTGEADNDVPMNADKGLNDTGTADNDVLMNDDRGLNDTSEANNYFIMEVDIDVNVTGIVGNGFLMNYALVIMSLCTRKMILK